MADVKNSATLTTGLVSYWELEESSGENRIDAHGTNDLTDSTTVASATGKVGNGADFEASNSEYLFRADNPSLSITTSYSTSFWIKYETTPGSGRYSYIAKADGGNGQTSYEVWTNWSTGKLMLFQSDDGSGGTNTEDGVTWSPSTATWYHVVTTYNTATTTAKFYINGSQQGSDVTSFDQASIYDGNKDFNLGCTFVTEAARGNFTDGIMDQVGLWGKVLTSSEITELYNSGNGLVYENIVSSSIPDVRLFFQ